MQGIRRVGRLAVAGLDVLSPQHLQAALRNPFKQLFTRAQLQMFSQVRQNQPAFAAGLQVGCQTGQKPAQHAAAFVVHRPLNGRAGPCGQPGRVAHHQRGLALGEQVLLLQLDAARQTQALQILARAGQRTRVLVGGHHALHTTARQHGRQHARAHAHIKGERLAGQRRLRDQIHIFPTHRRKNAVVRVNAVARRCAQGGYFHALLAPFMGAHQAQQLTQRSHHAIPAGRAPGLGAGLAQVGRAAQRNRVIAFQHDQHRRQHPRTLRLRLPVQVKRFRRGGRCRFLRRFGRHLAGLAVCAAHQRLQQHAGVLEIARPQQARAFTGHAIGCVGGQGVVGSDHAARSRSATLGAPLGGVGLALAAPFDHGRAQPLIGRFRRTSSILTPPMMAVLAVDNSRLKPASSWKRRARSLRRGTHAVTLVQPSS